MRYFLKELLKTRLHLPDGRQAPFEDCGDDSGILATEEPDLIAELDKAAERRIGGVVRITEADYERLKKNPLIGLRSSKDLNGAVDWRKQAENLQRDLARERAVGRGAVVDKQPITPALEIPVSIPRPPTMRPLHSTILVTEPAKAGNEK